MSQKGLTHQKKAYARNQRRAVKMDFRNSQLDEISALSEELFKTSRELKGTKDALSALQALYDADINFLQGVIADKYRTFRSGIVLGLIGALLISSIVWLVVG